MKDEKGRATVIRFESEDQLSDLKKLAAKSRQSVNSFILTWIDKERLANKEFLNQSVK